MTEGKWPTPFRRWKADFLSHNKAPESDGAVAPTFSPPEWLEEAAKWDGALDLARRSNDRAEDAVRTTEGKATRLLQNCFTLITISIAVGAFQLKAALSGTWPPSVRWALVFLPAAAIVLLVIAGVIAMEVDRVGFYGRASLHDLVAGYGSSTTVRGLAAEEEGRQLARWSGRHKLSDLMDARAWFTRGLTALIAAGLAAAITFGSGQPPATPDETLAPPTTMTATTTSTTAPTTTTRSPP